MAKRKVFISYHHKGEQSVVDAFTDKFSEDYDVFTDSSLSDAADSDDSEYLNQVCREAIDGTSVTIVMIGKQTGCRKFVDWEIRHTFIREHGLVAISRPDLAISDACLPKRLSDCNAPILSAPFARGFRDCVPTVSRKAPESGGIGKQCGEAGGNLA